MCHLTGQMRGSGERGQFKAGEKMTPKFEASVEEAALSTGVKGLAF